MGEFYKGQQGALRYIADITDDYDGCKSVESLKQLIDDVRKHAFRALKEKDNYDIKTIEMK